MMTLFGSQYAFGVFFKPMLDDFGWSRAITSGAYSMNVVIQGIFTILAGRLSDRFGPRIVVTVSAVLIGAGYFLMSRITAVWQIYVFYGILISLGSCVWVPLISTVARWFVRRRGMMSGTISAGIGLGMVVFPPLANRLIASYGWQLSYVIVGLSAAAVILAAAQLLRRDPAEKGLAALGAAVGQPQSPHPENEGYSLGEAIRTRQFWIICLAFFTSNFCVQMVTVHLVAHLTDMGIAAAAAASVLSGVGLLSIFSKIGEGGAIDRLGAKPVLVFVPAMMSLAFAWMLFAGQLWMFYVFAVIFAAGYGGSSAVQSPLVAEYFGLRHHGAIMGTILIGNYAGGALSPVLAGRIFDTNDSYRWAFVVSIIISLAAFTATLALKPLPRKSSAP